MTSGPSTILKSWLLVVAAGLFVHLGSAPLFDADEGRNAEVAREMAATNDYVMPRIDGMPYLDKPIVYFAAEAAAMEVLGPTELAARLPAALFTLLTAGILFWFARREWGSDAALAASIAYLSMPLTLAFARTVIFDSALTFFIVAAIVAFHCAVEEFALAGSLTRGARGAALVAWAAIGFGVITKGPVAIAVPLFVAIPYAIRRRAFRALWSFAGIAAMAVIITPWVWAVSQVVPDFLHYVLVTETAQRMATKALKRTGPPWYFIPYVLGGALPWSLVALAERRGVLDERRRNARLFLLLWILVPFVFFSISQSKRPQYILPVLPAIALFVGQMWDRERIAAGLRAAAVAILVLGCVLVAAPFIPVKMEPEIAAGVRASASPMGATALAGGLLALAFAWRRRELALVALTLPIITIPLLANPLMDAIGSRRSAKAFVARLQPYLRPSTEIVGLQAYTGSLQFYLRRPVTVITPNAEEFTSNYIIRHYDRFANDPSSPVRRLPLELTPTRVYVLRENDRLWRHSLERGGLVVIASGARFVAYALPAGRPSSTVTFVRRRAPA